MYVGPTRFRIDLWTALIRVDGMSQWVDRPPTSSNRLNTKKAIACASFWKYLVGIVYIFMHHYWLHFLYRQITYAPNRRLPVHRGWPMHIITKVTGLPSVFWDRLRKVNRPMSGDYTSVKEVVILHLLVCLWTWQLHESSTNFDEVFGVVSCVTCQQHSLVVMRIQEFLPLRCRGIIVYEFCW